VGSRVLRRLRLSRPQFRPRERALSRAEAHAITGAIVSEHTQDPNAPLTMSFLDYCALPGVNWSRLRLMDASPLHYHTSTVEETDPMRLGRAAHSLTFEPETFGKLYTVWGQARNSNAWRDFAAANAHLTILTAAQAERAVGMSEAVRRHPIAARYLDRGKAEQTLVWTDEATGLVCKARADFLSYWCAVVDLKSAADLSERGFQSSAFKFGYPCQLAHYRNGAIASGIWEREPDCVVIAVESKPPYDVGVFRLDSAALDFGAAKVAELLAKVKACTERGEWPGRYPDEQAYVLPEWAAQNPEITFTEDDTHE
jgi:hypothetical protein